jgi:polysaccharide pyruvyl transferase WcaK-like protein
MAATPTPVLRRYANAVIRRAVDPLAYLPAPGRPPTTTPVAGVVGYYGWGNYGDELFLEVFRQQLEPPVRLRTVLDPRAGRIRGRAIGRAVRASDVMLIGGGDIVIPWSQGTRYWDRAYLRRPTFIAGVGVPTWGGSQFERRDALQRFFQHPNVRYIGVRDAASATFIRDRLQPRVPVIETPDLVCALELPAVERPADPPIFGIAVRRRKDKDDLTAVRALALRAQQLGYRVRRIVLGTGRTRLRDEEATAELDLPDTELVASDDLMVITRAIGECTAMASMKFHGFVVATMYGVPCFVLMPTAKNRYLVDTIGRRDLLSQFGDRQLGDRLAAGVAPIEPAVVARLRADAVASLVDLRASIVATTS